MDEPWINLRHWLSLGGCQLSRLDHPIYLGHMQPMQPDDHQHYQDRVRQSLLTRTPGRMWARASLICAVWSLFLAPAVFGPLGVAAGMVAVAKGDSWCGVGSASPGAPWRRWLGISGVR